MIPDGLRAAAGFLLFTASAILSMQAMQAASSPRGIRPERLRCEDAENPLGIDIRRPLLGWALLRNSPDDRGQSQTAYRIQVASSEGRLRSGRADVWDSGRVASSESLHLSYGGRPLGSRQRVYWRVRVWDRDGRASPYSEPAWWEMALLEPGDWQARWITRDAPPRATPAEFYQENPAPLFRKEFSQAGEVERARVYVSGLGYYELYLNGRRVGDHVLDPAWTSYDRRVYYSTYDVTHLLQSGANALGAMLGSGWYDPLPMPLFGRFNLREHLTVGPPRLIAQLEITYRDGSRQVVPTGTDWRVGDGPILKNSVYLGELYDARREQPGWNRPGFDDTSWRPPAEPAEPVGPLRAQDLPPIRVGQTVKPVRVTEPRPGVYIWDMGRNFAGWITLRASGPAGTRVSLRYGELLYPDGTLNGMTSVAGQIKNRPVEPGSGAPSTAFQNDVYVLKGEGEEVYTPRFTFHGFRYVEVTGLPEKPALEALEGHLLHSDVAPAGEFACSSELFNRIQEMVRWTALSNLFSVQSDCPHREKLGYGGDIAATSEMAILNFDMARFYRKTVRDFADAARPNGGLTETAPYVGIADAGLGGGSGPVEWGTAHPLLLRQLYQYYGERRLLEEQYEVARGWVELLRSRAENHILDNGIGDHETLAPKVRPLMGTAYYYYNVRLLAEIAGLAGRAADAEQYGKLAGEIRDALNRRFLKPGSGRYDIATQACQAIPLALGLVPPEERSPAVDVLVHDVLDEHQGHLTTGIFGTKYLLTTLSDAGRADVAYTIASRKEFPGWGYMLEHGATTLWEHWAFSDNTYSHNHPMFGTVSEWFFKSLAGIQPDPEASGFDRILIRPHPVKELDWARAAYDSARGVVRSEWRREAKALRLDVSVPVGCTATVCVPAGAGASVTEGNGPAAEADGVQFLRRDGEAIVFQVGSGAYHFVAQ